MSVLKKAAFVLVLIVLFVAASFFAIRNSTPISLDFVFFKTAPQNLTLILISSLILGFVLGMLASSYSLIRLQLRNRRLARAQESKNRELQSLLKEKS